MTLNSSGPISIGGSTSGQSINLELVRSATAQSSLNEIDLRALANIFSGQISLSNFYGQSVARGQQLFEYTGTAVSFVVPDKVISICVACVGGGSAGVVVLSGGSENTPRGAQLAYANNISVTPGETLTVYVGKGASYYSPFTMPYAGELSQIRRGSTILVRAMGGSWNNSGSAVGDASYSGNALALSAGGSSLPARGSGGGGAAGYSGNGGAGGSSSFSNETGINGQPGQAGTGGAGGGGGAGNSGVNSGVFYYVNPGGGGGGVGINGAGGNGTGGTGGAPYGGGGGSGSWANDISASRGNAGYTFYSDPLFGGNGASYLIGGNGGKWGGAGGNSGLVSYDAEGTNPYPGIYYEVGAGGNGACRIIWGPVRSYPSNASNA